jgi:hypothetical protein
MNRKRFEQLTIAMKNTTDMQWAIECYSAIMHEKTIVHNVGIFEKENVVNTIKDKIAMAGKGNQKTRILGIDLVHDKLLNFPGDKVREFTITTENGGYMIISTPKIDTIISISKEPEKVMSRDWEHQLYLKKMGYPNKKIYLFEKGGFVSRIG